MKLSVIIPVFNGAPFLEQLIDTISAFTFKDFECVFIDNNSKDNSLSILKSLLETVSFNHIVLTEERQGAGYARNTGIDVANGEFLAFLDCDDIILPEKFDYDFKILETYDVDFVFCRSKRFYNNRVIKHPIKGIKEGVNIAPALGHIWLRNFFCLQGPGSVVVKKDVVDKLGGFHTSYTGEDAFLFIRMGLVYNGYFYNNTYFHYFRHKLSTISKSNKETHGALKRYFELRQNLFVDDVVKSDDLAMSILNQQLQMDVLKLQNLGVDIQPLLKSENLMNLKRMPLLFNPISLVINKHVTHIKFNPFFQVYMKFFKKPLN